MSQITDGSTGSEEGDQQPIEGQDETEEDGGSEEAEAPDQSSMRAEPFESDDANTALTIRCSVYITDCHGVHRPPWSRHHAAHRGLVGGETERSHQP